MNTLKFLSAALFSFLSFIGFCLLTILICADIPVPYHILVGLVIMASGLYASYFVFNMMNRRGAMEVMAGDNSSYELDNLEPMPGDGVAKMSANELAVRFSNKKLMLPSVSISIWGDQYGRHLSEQHIIENISFDKEKKILSIVFANRFILKIKSPGIALVTTNYLKILKAQEVMWQTKLAASGRRQYNYRNTGNSILTKSNTDWQPSMHDLGVGMNALYLRG